MRYQVFLMRKERVGPFWNRRTEYNRVKENLCSTEVREAALAFANAYSLWANEAVIVADLNANFDHVGDSRWIFIKRGSNY